MSPLDHGQDFGPQRATGALLAARPTPFRAPAYPRRAQGHGGQVRKFGWYRPRPLPTRSALAYLSPMIMTMIEGAGVLDYEKDPEAAALARRGRAPQGLTS